MIRYKFCVLLKGEEQSIEMQLPPPLVTADQTEELFKSSIQAWATDFGKRAFIKKLDFDHLEYWNEKHQCWVTVQ